jgi:hypothetical protein
MGGEVIYREEVSSGRTEALFVALMLLFFALGVRRTMARGLGKLAAVFLGLGAFFLFYVVNYRRLVIELSARSLKLSFGIFSWNVALKNMAEARIDDVPTFKRLGGAGIHFMTVKGRYRASFNFLEHPRVVVAFKEKRGPVRDISFSTSRPEELLGLIQGSQQESADNK